MENNTEQQGRVNPSKQSPPNPAKYFAQWKSDEKCFAYYDKVNKKNVPLPLPFTFLPLERCIAIRGYNEPEKCSYISNEVKADNMKKEVFTIRRYDNTTKKSKIYIKGLYDDIKTQAAAVNAGYVESIYAAIKGEKDELILVNVQLSGASMTHWFDFIKTNNIWNNAVTVKSFSEHKKGKVNYTAPVFEAVKIKKETDIKAAVLQKEILNYLDNYYAEQQNSTFESEQPKETPKAAAPIESHNDAPPIVTFNTNDEDDGPPF